MLNRISFLRVVLSVVFVAAVAASSAYKKIDPNLNFLLDFPANRANVVVTFNQKVDPVIKQVNQLKFSSKGTKLTFLKSQLENLQTSTQSKAIQILQTFPNIKFHSLWINNRLYIQNAMSEIIQRLASLPQVSQIRKQLNVKLSQNQIQNIESKTRNEISPNQNNNETKLEWGIEKIQADRAWNLPGGNNGANVTVGIIGSGVRHTHEAINGSFRGVNYGWYDPYSNVETPVDILGIGTHVTGIIAGSGGIGVAPGAQWISCLGCRLLYCNEESMSLCAQWMTCPTLANGSNPDCSKAPQVISNSWGIGQNSDWFDDIFKTWHAAGIIPVFEIGDDGWLGCNTTRSPGDRPLAIGVGSTRFSDDIALFSSRGPTIPYDIKPDITAPGTEIRSAASSADNAYGSLSGSSQAAPHVAGTVALLLARNPNLSFEEVKKLLTENTNRDLGQNEESCGDTRPNKFPNNIYGYGRLNARRALEATITAARTKRS